MFTTPKYFIEKITCIHDTAQDHAYEKLYDSSEKKKNKKERKKNTVQIYNTLCRKKMAMPRQLTQKPLLMLFPEQFKLYHRYFGTPSRNLALKKNWPQQTQENLFHPCQPARQSGNQLSL
jgi:hypothetical protein